METAARVVLGAFAAIVLVHYMQGGRAQAKAYLGYVFAGRAEPFNPWTPTGRSGTAIDSKGRKHKVPTQKRTETLPDGTVVETEIAVP